MKPILAVTIALPFLCAACAHHPAEYDVGSTAPQPAPQGVSLAGTWTYNPDASDQPGQLVGGGYGGGRRGGFGGGFGGGGRFGGGMGGRGGEGGEGRRGRGGQPGDSTMREPPGRLVIVQTDSSMVIGARTPRDSVVDTLFFDGRSVMVRALDGSQQSLSGRWNKGRFEVTRELPNGGTLTEGYELAKHGQRLVIHLKVSRPQNDEQRVMPEFRRVYDRYGS